MDAKLAAETANAVITLIAGLLALVAAITSIMSRRVGTSRGRRKIEFTLSDVFFIVCLAFLICGGVTAVVAPYSYPMALFFMSAAISYAICFATDKQPIARWSILSLVIHWSGAAFFTTIVFVVKLAGILQELIRTLKG